MRRRRHAPPHLVARERAVVVGVSAHRGGRTPPSSSRAAASPGTRLERQRARAALSRALRPYVGVAHLRDPLVPLE